MRLGFSSRRGRAGFDPAKPGLDRRMRSDGEISPGRLSAQAGASGRPLCRPRPKLRPGCGQRANVGCCGRLGRTLLLIGRLLFL